MTNQEAKIINNITVIPNGSSTLTFPKDKHSVQLRN